MSYLVLIAEQGGKQCSKVTCYSSSLRPGVRRLAAVFRGHGGGDNSLRRTVDVTFERDQSRLCMEYASNAFPRRFAFSLLQRDTSPRQHQAETDYEPPETTTRLQRSPCERVNVRMPWRSPHFMHY